MDSHDGKDDVGLPTNTGKRNWGDHDDHEVEGPVGRSGESVGRSTNAQGHDLSGVEPGLGACQ